MFSPVLAIVDFGETPEPNYAYGQYVVIGFGIIMLLFSAFAMWATSTWLIRTFRLMRRASQTTFPPTDDPMQQVADARAHLDASKRHIAALEEKLDQIQDQLKRRPLS